MCKLNSWVVSRSHPHTHILSPVRADLAFDVVLNENAVNDPAINSPSELVLRLLDSSPAAKCLDGRPSGYYYRRGSDDWVIYLEGGTSTNRNLWYNARRVGNVHPGERGHWHRRPQPQ